MNKKLNNIIEILKELMKYKTVEGNQKEFDKLIIYIKELIPKELLIEEYEFKKHKCLVISNTDSKKLDLVFCTHIDVVPASNYNIEETEELIKGRGSFDMKGSVAVCLELFKNLKTNKKVALFITSDEELTGYCAKKLLEIYDTDFAIVPDGGKDYEIITEEKGQLQLKISIETKSAHASQPYNGINAITSLYDVYENILKKYPLPKSSKEYITSINLSMIKGGEALNSVASNATMYLDIRHTSKDTKEQILKYLKAINNNLDIEIIHEGNLFMADKNNPKIKNYITISEKILNNKIKISTSEATSDAIYFSDKKIPTILTNPIGGYPHSPEEFVEKESLYYLYEIWEEVIKGES